MIKVSSVLLTASFWLLLSCEKDLEFDLKEEPPRLVLYSLICPDSLISVWVTQSESVLDAKPIRAISNATVTITPEGETPRQLRLQDRQRGHYRADFAPQPGTAYHLKVVADGVPVAEATTLVPVPTPVQQVEQGRPFTKRISCLGPASCDSLVTLQPIALTFEDPTEENYYEVVSYVQYVTEKTVYDFLTDTYDVVIDTAVYAVNQGSNDRALDLSGETLSSLRFNEDRDLQFSDQLFNGLSYTFKYNIASDLVNAQQIIIVLRTYHPEAYRYLRGREAAQFSPSSLGEPTQLPQNIQGGYGIFSSYSQDTVVIELS